MFRFALLLLLLPIAATGAENLNHNDLVGTWKSYWSAVDGEVNSLTINDDLSSHFARASVDSPSSLKYSWKSPEMLFVDDVAIIEFRGDEGELIYKLVLAGWKDSTTRRLFGQMYMYRDGHLFNGLPIALENNSDGKD